MAMSITLFEAWSLWWDGQLDSQRTLWGVELFWWARFGKALQLLAGATIIVEIVGAPALRSFGNSLHDRVSLNFIRENVTHTLRSIKLSWRFYFQTHDKDEEEKLHAELLTYRSHKVSLALAVVAGVAFWNRVTVSDFWVWQFLASFATFVIVGTIVAPLAVLGATILLFGIGILLDIILIEPVAWVLEREYLDKIIKLLAFLALIVGFHFDFLAS